MDIISAILAGLAGTLIMTILMYVVPAMGMPKMDIINMLGAMFTADQSTARIIGVLVHFMMGAVFAVLYDLLWSLGIGSPTWWWGLVFGALHGLIAAVTMPLMLNMHPRPPQMERGPKMIVGLLLGHLVFGLVVALTYRALVA